MDGGVRLLLGDGVPMPPRLIIDEMLFPTEWPQIVDAELVVSDETVDNGRGMYSTFSEKPTRGRDAGRAVKGRFGMLGEPEDDAPKVNSLAAG